MAEGLILPNCLTVPSIYDAGESQGLILKAAAPSPQEDYWAPGNAHGPGAPGAWQPHKGKVRLQAGPPEPGPDSA